MLTQLVKAYRRAHPGEPVEVGVLPDDTVRLLLRGLDRFDLRFGAAFHDGTAFHDGAAFHDGTWNEGFDHAAALAEVDCPALLLQADFWIRPDGTLNGAMTQPDAERAASLLRNGTYRKVDATHVVHLADPALFVRMVTDFFLAPQDR